MNNDLLRAIKAISTTGKPVSKTGSGWDLDGEGIEAMVGDHQVLLAEDADGSTILQVWADGYLICSWAIVKQPIR